MQQFFLTDWWGFDACKQQLCAALCAGCRQIPDGASNEPIKTMAKAARWKTPFRMTGVYHKIDSTGDVYHGTVLGVEEWLAHNPRKISNSFPQ